MTQDDPSPPRTRTAGSLPFPDRPVGAVNEEMPFDHVVVVMMENHSFDNLLGALARIASRRRWADVRCGGQRDQLEPGRRRAVAVTAFPLTSTAQATHVTQSWRATHEQIDGGAMDGFVRSASGNPEPMGYYTAELLPFAYSLANTFTLANRWFCSVPGPTYPNRRFLLAGTAYGGTVTDLGALLDPAPPHGTIFDRLSHQHISWSDYFTDVPMTAVIPTIVLKHLDHHHRIEQVLRRLPGGYTAGGQLRRSRRSGVLSAIASPFSALPAVVKEPLKLLGAALGASVRDRGGPREHVLRRGVGTQGRRGGAELPAWARTLLIYTYDEHGGYYDHVPPPPRSRPTTSRRSSQPGDPPGGYDIYGPRVPAIVVSPYSKPGGVTDVVHDHTSVLATIEHKWNLPALTNRDANAAPVMDFLNPDDAALLTPPPIAAPSSTGPSGPVSPQS